MFKLRLNTPFGYIRAQVNGKQIFIEKTININSNERYSLLTKERLMTGKISLKSLEKDDVIEYMKRMKNY